MRWLTSREKYFPGVCLLFFIISLLNLSSASDASFAQRDTVIAKPKMVVLIHGLMRTSTSMFFLKYYLKKQGYEVYSYNYPSAKRTLDEHSLQLNHFLHQLIAQHPTQPLYLVTHSMGGIIARKALANLPEKQMKYIGGLIMLAPPNQGSSLAQFTLSIIPGLSYFIKPLPELSTQNKNYLHQLPVPKIKIGIIAGRYDAKVPPHSAYLEGQQPPVVVNSTHTFIMNNAEVKRLITRFIEKGTF